MANWDDLKQTFFEETNEGLEALVRGRLAEKLAGARQDIETYAATR